MNQTKWDNPPLERSRRWSHRYGREVDLLQLRFAPSKPPPAASELLAAIDRISSSFSSDTLFKLPAAHAKLRFHLEALGFAKAAVDLGGDVAIATELLHRKEQYLTPHEAFRHQGLKLLPLCNSNQITAVQSLKNRLFRQQPQLCWYYPDNSAVQERERRHWLAGVDRPQLCRRWLVQSASGTEGMFGFSAAPAPDTGQLNAGCDLVLSSEFQGRGLGRYAYSLILKTLAELGIDSFSGSTHNPSVLHLACVMARPVTQYCYRWQPGTKGYDWIEHFPLNLNLNQGQPGI